MLEIKSHNSSPTQAFRSLLVPSLTEALLYLFISMLLLALLKAQAIWHWVTGNLATSSSSSIPAAHPSAIHSFWTFISQGRLPQILFWITVGIVVYSLIWFAWNIINNVRNDIVAADYVHPRSYNRKGYWESVLARKAVFVISVIVLFSYAVVVFKLFLVMADLSYAAIESSTLLNSLTLVASSALVGALSIYFLVVLGRLVGNSWQAIYKDL